MSIFFFLSIRKRRWSRNDDSGDMVQWRMIFYILLVWDGVSNNGSAGREKKVNW